MMNFSISLNHKTYHIDLGTSVKARKIYISLQTYESTSNYSDLEQVFINLAQVIDKNHPQYNSNACFATQLLAQKVFPELNLVREKKFVANTVVHVYAKAHFPVPDYWNDISNLYLTMLLVKTET